MIEVDRNVNNGIAVLFIIMALLSFSGKGVSHNVYTIICDIVRIAIITASQNVNSILLSVWFSIFPYTRMIAACSL